MVHGLVDPAVVDDEPEVDDAERSEHVAPDAGLLLDFTDRGVLGGLAVFDVPLGQRPQQPPLAVAPGDERHPGHRPRAVDHHPSRRGLLDLPEVGPTAAPPTPTRRTAGRAS